MGAPPLSVSASLRLPIIRRHLSQIAPASVVEVGCGMGSMAYRLASAYDYRGYEPDPISFARAADRLSGLERGQVYNQEIPSVPDRSFDLLVAFEVLEHIGDDVTALRSWANWVSPGGSVLLSVPADPGRYGPCDRAVGHCRRYSRERLLRVAAEAGVGQITIERWGMPLGYALEAVRNRVATRRESSESRCEGTPGSGRMLQPPGWLGRGVEHAVRPFALLQRPFADTERGIGFILRGRVPG